MPSLRGWLFEVYPQGDGVSVWVLDSDGAMHHLHETLAPSFFCYGKHEELGNVCRWLARARLPVRLKRAERYDLMLRSSLVLLEIQVLEPTRFGEIVRRVTETFPPLDYYNADITIPQFYFFEKNLFPLARVELSFEPQDPSLGPEEGRIIEIEAEDSPWALDYPTPPLKTLLIRMEGENINPNHGYRAPLEMTYEDRTYVLQARDSKELLLRVRDHLRKADPDLIITDWGDSFLLPQLLELSKQYGVPLPLNRDPRKRAQSRPARSYFSYGRIIYKTASQVLFGRWHIDRENAFLSDDYGLEGMFEIARITQQPVQHAARTSTGSGISAMEVSTAYRMGYLVPWRKREPEEWKTAMELIVSDKGGMTYQPIVGLHYDVAELDFASMYPAIMERFNVSPETIHCSCCPESRVPEIGYSVCRKQRGLVPATLGPLIDKRLAYKKLKKSATDPIQKELYSRRASAHKWLLVTCFGYLGYKNARFGRIEAHEAVTAYGRESLLLAKEIVEARGFRVLHALTDSLWIQKRGTKEDEYAAIVEEIERETRLPLELDGLYTWVAFLSSRVDARRAVPNRYFGVRRDGELKIRGIELRRHDTPEFIKQAQKELLEELARASTNAGTRGGRDAEKQGRKDPGFLPSVEMTNPAAEASTNGHCHSERSEAQRGIPDCPNGNEADRDSSVACAPECATLLRMTDNNTCPSPKRTCHFERQREIPDLDPSLIRAQLAASLPALLEIITRKVETLRAGQAPMRELALSYHLSRDPSSYQTNTLNAIVARELAGRGVDLSPGESIHYVITEYKAEAASDRARAWEFIDGSWGYDAERYVELLMRSVETVLEPFGLSGSMLRNWLVKELPAEHLRARLEAKKARAYLGPLFEYKRSLVLAAAGAVAIRDQLASPMPCNLPRPAGSQLL